MNWLQLDALSGLDALDKRSFSRDVLIFKHSTSCPISHIAKRRIEDSWDEENLELEPCYLDLKVHRDVSNAIAEKYDVHHESPQVLIIRSGECIYENSHLDITLDEIKEVIA